VARAALKIRPERKQHRSDFPWRLAAEASLFRIRAFVPNGRFAEMQTRFPGCPIMPLSAISRVQGAHCLALRALLMRF
jgi:hypothetical protein